MNIERRIADLREFIEMVGRTSKEARIIEACVSQLRQDDEKAKVRQAWPYENMSEANDE